MTVTPAAISARNHASMSGLGFGWASFPSGDASSITGSVMAAVPRGRGVLPHHLLELFPTHLAFDRRLGPPPVEPFECGPILLPLFGRAADDDDFRLVRPGRLTGGGRLVGSLSH